VSDLLQRAEAEIQKRQLFKRGEGILVTVSGGPDSMVLLYLLCALSKKWRWKIVVAHFNHQLRGRASDADEKLVRKTAARLKLQVATGCANVKEVSRKSKLSIEMAARKLRHEFFARMAAKHRLSTIALAHQADDQVEHFFLRLLRGAGSEGLQGMRWRSPSPTDPKIALVRPLLGFTKAELLAFARENRIRFREDQTNFSTDFLRSRIRNELLPLLRRKYQPGLTKTVLRLMEIIGAESDFIGAAVQQWLRKSAGPDLTAGWVARRRPANHWNFDRLPVAVQRRVLQHQLAERGITANFELVERLRASPDTYVSASANISAVRDPSGNIKLRAESGLEFNANERATNLTNRPGSTVFDGVKLNWRTGAAKEFLGRKFQGRPATETKKEVCEFFDADKIGGRMVLRHWRPGDRFHPIGLKSAAKLQDLFVNAKVPREQRRNLIVAEAAGGDIFWVQRLRISDRFKLTRQTKRCLLWRWRRLN
jgi:tRNA(Ile)-lysidine synthase